MLWPIDPRDTHLPIPSPVCNKTQSRPVPQCRIFANTVSVFSSPAVAICLLALFVSYRYSTFVSTPIFLTDRPLVSLHKTSRVRSPSALRYDSSTFFSTAFPKVADLKTSEDWSGPTRSGPTGLTSRPLVWLVEGTATVRSPRLLSTVSDAPWTIWAPIRSRLNSHNPNRFQPERSPPPLLDGPQREGQGEGALQRRPMVSADGELTAVGGRGAFNSTSFGAVSAEPLKHVNALRSRLVYGFQNYLQFRRTASQPPPTGSNHLDPISPPKVPGRHWGGDSQAVLWGKPQRGVFIPPDKDLPKTKPLERQAKREVAAHGSDVAEEGDDQATIDEFGKRRRRGDIVTALPTNNPPTKFATGPVEGTTPSRISAIMGQLRELTLVEAAALVTMIEKEFGVDASLTVGGSAATPKEEKEDEEDFIPIPTQKTAFEVWLLSVEMENRIKLIKLIRDLRPELNLIQSKAVVDAKPVCVIGPTDKDTAEEAFDKMTELAKVEMR